MFFKKKEKAPMVFVIKSDEVDETLLESIKKQLSPAFPDKNVAVVCIAPNEDMYAITG